MDQTNIVTGVSGAFWSLTYAVITLTIIVAAIGGQRFIQLYLAVMATYAITGIAYGAWAARSAVARSHKAR